jgi:ribosomal protein S6
MADVFISYARDDQPLAWNLAQHLEEFGFAVFDYRMDTKSWVQRVGDAIRKSQVVVVFWSPNRANVSREVCAAAEAAEKPLLVAYEAGTLDASEPHLTKYHTFSYDPVALDGLALLAEAVDHAYRATDVEALSPPDTVIVTHTDEDHLQPVIDHVRSGEWSLAHWMKRAELVRAETERTPLAANKIKVRVATFDASKSELAGKIFAAARSDPWRAIDPNALNLTRVRGPFRTRAAAIAAVQPRWKYEHIFFVKGDGSRVGVDKVITEFTTFLAKHGAEALKVEYRGYQRPFSAKGKGRHAVIATFEANSSTIALIEDRQRKDKRVARFKTFQADENDGREARRPRGHLGTIDITTKVIDDPSDSDGEELYWED